MKSAIKQIYEKQLGYRESEYDEKEYLEMKEEYCKAYEALEETLNEEQKKMLTELFDCEGGERARWNFCLSKTAFVRAYGWELNYAKKKNKIFVCQVNLLDRRFFIPYNRKVNGRFALFTAVGYL